MGKKKIAPAKKIEGVVELPGDKSISHRYAILAALAEGPSQISNYASAADCQSTLKCLERLGVKVQKNERVVSIMGNGLDGLNGPSRTLDAENSGTTIRLLSGVLAGQKFDSKITGDSSLRKRPMRRVIDPLTEMGADIKFEEGGRAPLRISGRTLRGISHIPQTPSAQVKSAILLAGLFAEGETSVQESVPTRDHLEIALREFGAQVNTVNRVTRIKPRPKLQGRALEVPGDLSSAVFFIAAALILPGSQVIIHNVGLNPTRSRVLDVLISMGAPIHIASLQLRDGELVGDLAVEHANLTGGEISGAQVAEMIDELPMLAALGPLHGAGNHDSRCQGIARERKRSHRCHGGSVARDGRASGRISGWPARGRTLGRKIARRENRSAQ